MSQSTPIDFDNPPFDPEALREKYRRERDKRLRPQGEAQYVETTGEFADFSDIDPFAGPPHRDKPVSLHPEIVIIGGGFAGLLSCVRLIEAGIDDFLIMERGADFGGTWYWNRYPGAQCDIESYCYMPLLEETGYIPSQKYADATEIFEHCQRIGKQWDLYRRTIFGTYVNAIDWDRVDKRWRISTNRDDDIRARFVISASGPGTNPRLPGIPGIKDFTGKMFHSSRWDYEYTGGDHCGGLTRLGDKKVAVIGTGASAIQIVPYLGEYAEQLTVFQRTPSSVDIRGNKPTDPEWARSLKPGWQRRRKENFNDVVSGAPFEVDLVMDSWTNMFRNLKNGLSQSEEKSSTGVSVEEVDRLSELADFENMERIRARVDELVKDEATAELLKPWYRQFCKRPCFSDEFLLTFNRANVQLVDVSLSQGVERITATGIIANATEYPVDCIIFATGFEISTPFRQRYRYEVNGVGGQSIYDYWKDGRRTFHGHSTHGFPNWFFIGLSQVGYSVDYTSMADDQAHQVAYILSKAKQRNATVVEATAEAEAVWVDEIRTKAADLNEFFLACTPGYYNNEGQIAEVVATLQGDFYAPGVNAFNRILKEWRDQGDCRGLRFT